MEIFFFLFATKGLPDTRRGESILGFYVRAGLWIDGIEILTSLGRKSGVFGNARGGSGYVQGQGLLIPQVLNPDNWQTNTVKAYFDTTPWLSDSRSFGVMRSLG